MLLRLALRLEGVGPDAGLVSIVVDQPELLALQGYPNGADLGNEVTDVLDDRRSPSNYNSALVESGALGVVDL